MIGACLFEGWAKVNVLGNLFSPLPPLRIASDGRGFVTHLSTSSSSCLSFCFLCSHTLFVLLCFLFLVLSFLYPWLTHPLFFFPFPFSCSSFLDLILVLVLLFCLLWLTHRHSQLQSGEEAAKMCESDAIAFAPCHDHSAVGPMAGIISPSFPVWVVENHGTMVLGLLC